MTDFLNRIHLADEKNYTDSMQNTVEPYLNKKRKQGFFKSFDGKELYYEAYERTFPKGNVIILHGFTESAEKFYEVAYCFLKGGYNVFLTDLRGHGKSYRSSTVPEKVEIDSFDTYRDDLECFIDNIVKPMSKNKKIHIYSHSLGSTVALLYLIKHPYIIDKAVLSSPMICGNMGMPVFVAGTAAKLLCLVGGKKIPAPGRCVFNPHQTVQESDAVSTARFNYYHNKRIQNPLYKTSGPSFSWVEASLKARDEILKKDNLKLITTSLLVVKPQQDKQLLMEYTDKFIELSGAKVKNAKDTKHEIFMSHTSTLEWYFEEIFEFLSDND